jgi:hypothetical protein
MESNWDKAKNDVGNVKIVQELIQSEKVYTRGMRNKPYLITLAGKQRRSSVRGEAKIEKALLSGPKRRKVCWVIKEGKKIKSIYFLDNAVTLGSTRKDNVITDLFGLDDIGSPVCGEVKISDKNPWYAVVECIRQVVLVRSDRKFLMKNLREKEQKNIRGRGSWGLVIAPPRYWGKAEFFKAKKLVDYLRLNTKIRICCVSYPDTLDANEILLKVVCGLPPTTQSKRYKL